MTYIKRIKINNFRSIKSLDIKTSELSVLIGQNDSGKSNILRALNLFFNGKTSYNTDFNFNDDFSFFSSDRQKRQGVQIELEIELPSNYHKTNGQRIIWAKRWLRTKTDHKSKYYGLRDKKNSHHITKPEKVILPPKSNVHTLLEQINFVYVPAIKDATYFDQLRGSIYGLVADVAGKTFRESSHNFEQSIATHLQSLTNDISKKLKFDTKLVLPRDMRHIFERLDFQSGEFGVSLENRGDGVKARHIPIILNYMAEQKKQLKGKGAAPYTFIWGYEEPENNVEMSRCFEMLNDFISFLKNNVDQLFLTTHSPIFCALGNQDNGCLYHIYLTKEENTTSATTEDKGLDDLMGITQFISPYIKQAKSDLDAEKIRREAAENLIANSEQQKKWLFVEDEYDQIYKVAWLKLHDIEFTTQNIEQKYSENSQFSIAGLKSAGSVAGFLRTKNTSHIRNHKIIGLFDFDKEGTENFYHLKKDEDFWKAENSGKKDTGYYKKRTDHPNFYGMLIPIPSRISTLADLEYDNFANYVEIENLLPDIFLRTKKLVNEKKAAGNINYLKIKKTCKKNLWKKTMDLSKENFNDFIPLFNTVEQLFETSA